MTKMRARVRALRRTLKGVLLRSAPGERVKLEVTNGRAEPANTPIVEQARERIRSVLMALVFVCQLWLKEAGAILGPTIPGAPTSCCLEDASGEI